MHFMAVDSLNDYPNLLVRLAGSYYSRWALLKALKSSDIKLVKSNRDSEILRNRYNVVFTGTLETKDLLAAYAVADVFISLSAQEAFGLSVVEAMSMEVPVVAHRWKGLSYILKDGVNGLSARAPRGLLEALRTPSR
jgi:glycosyltransferase involved in cell wall biosynthesis